MSHQHSLLGKISEQVERLLAAYPGHFLVEVRLLPKNKLQVIADADTGITVNTCAEINRSLQKTLEEEKWLGDDYEIEVSSPGLDAPLKMLRQYQRRIGKEVEVLLSSGIKYTGRLTAANEQELKLEIHQNDKRKKQAKTEIIEIPFSSIKYTKLKLNF